MLAEGVAAVFFRHFPFFAHFKKFKTIIKRLFLSRFLILSNNKKPSAIL